MRRVMVLMLSLVALGAAGCKDDETAPATAPASTSQPAQKDGPALDGDVTLLVVAGKSLVVLKDGKYEKVKGHVGDSLTPVSGGFYFRTAPPNAIQRYVGGAFEDLTYPDAKTGIGFYGVGPKGAAWLSVHSKDASAAKLAHFSDGKWTTTELPELDPAVKQVKSLAFDDAGEKLYVLASDFQGKLGPTRSSFHVGPRGVKGKWLSVEIPTKKPLPGWDLVVTPEGVLVHTDEALLRVRETSGSLEIETVEEGRHLVATRVDGDTVVVKGLNRLAVLEGGKLTPSTDFGPTTMEAFAAGADGTMAAAYRDPRHIKVRSPDGEVRRFPATGAMAYPVRSLDKQFHVDGSGRVWAGTDHGMIVVADGKLRYLPTGSVEAIDDEVTAIYTLGRGASPEGFGDPVPITITGTIVVAGKPLAQANVQTCNLDVTEVGQPGRPTERFGGGFCGRGNPDVGSLRFETKTDANGAFSFQVPPGAWRFGFEAQKGWTKLNKRFCQKTKPGETCEVGNLAKP